MHDEWSDRQRAVRLRLAGERVQDICRVLKRTERWFHQRWQCYLTAGPEGLYDLTRAHHPVVNRIPPHMERAILSVRRRLAARATPDPRYSLLAAATIRQALAVLGLSPLPSRRTIERVLERGHWTCPPLRVARRLAHADSPGPQAPDTNPLHQVDVVGPRFLQGYRL